MKIKIKHIILLIFIIQKILGSAITAFAYNDTIGANGNGYNSAEEVFQTYGPGTEHEESGVTKWLKKEADGTNGYTQSVLIGSETYWYNPEDEDDIIADGDYLDKKILYAKNDKDSLRRFDDATNNKSVKADSGKAQYILEGLTDTISIILGFLVVAISVGITLSTALDVAFMALPVFRAGLDNIKWFKSKDGDNKIRVVSDDAQYAVMVADTIKPGQNSMIIYFKSRILTYMILAVLLFILITNKIPLLAKAALNLVAGIINLIVQVG